jgi:hypothetical protein
VNPRRASAPAAASAADGSRAGAPAVGGAGPRRRGRLPRRGRLLRRGGELHGARADRRGHRRPAAIPHDPGRLADRPRVAPLEGEERRLVLRRGARRHPLQRGVDRPLGRGAVPHGPLDRRELGEGPRREEVVAAERERRLEEPTGLGHPAVELRGEPGQEEQGARRLGVRGGVALEHDPRALGLAPGEPDLRLELQRLRVARVEREPLLREGERPVDVAGGPARARRGGQEPSIDLGTIELRVEDADGARGVRLQAREPEREPGVRVARRQRPRLPRDGERLGPVLVPGHGEEDPGVGGHQLGALRVPLPRPLEQLVRDGEVLAADRVHRLAGERDHPAGERVQAPRIRDQRVAERAERLGDPLRQVRGEGRAPRGDALLGDRAGVEPRRDAARQPRLLPLPRLRGHGGERLRLRRRCAGGREVDPHAEGEEERARHEDRARAAATGGERPLQRGAPRPGRGRRRALRRRGRRGQRRHVGRRRGGRRRAGGAERGLARAEGAAVEDREAAAACDLRHPVSPRGARAAAGAPRRAPRGYGKPPPVEKEIGSGSARAASQARTG